MKSIIKRIEQLEQKVMFEDDEVITFTLTGDDDTETADSYEPFCIKIDVVTDYAKKTLKKYRKKV